MPKLQDLFRHWEAVQHGAGDLRPIYHLHLLHLVAWRARRIRRYLHQRADVRRAQRCLYIIKKVCYEKILLLLKYCWFLFICRFRTATRLCWKRGFKITSSSEDSPITTSQLDGSGFLSPISSSHQEGQLLQNTQIYDFHRIIYLRERILMTFFFKDWGIWRGGTRKDEGGGEGTEDRGWRTRRTEDRGRGTRRTEEAGIADKLTDVLPSSSGECSIKLWREIINEEEYHELTMTQFRRPAASLHL